MSTKWICAVFIEGSLLIIPEAGQNRMKENVVVYDAYVVLLG